MIHLMEHLLHILTISDLVTLLLITCTTIAQFSNGIVTLYERSRQRLTDVPDDIPDDTTRVQLSFNHIQIVKCRAFSHLSLCLELDLRENIIHEIEPEAFDGLKSLKILDLSNNRLKVKQDSCPALCTAIINHTIYLHLIGTKLYSLN